MGMSIGPKLGWFTCDVCEREMISTKYYYCHTCKKKICFNCAGIHKANNHNVVQTAHRLNEVPLERRR